ncbi:N-acetylmuramoyl-L-alanine amidase, partial [bacterium]
TLEQRSEIANRENADFFVSVHSNSARSSKLSGFEVYYVTDKINDAERALKAARSGDLNIDPGSFYKNSLDLKAALWDMLYTRYRGDSIILAQSICEAAGRGMGVKILGVKSARFYVLKGARIPAVLIETGFLSNPAEERYLRNGFYRQQIAEAICEGIILYGRRCELARRE